MSRRQLERRGSKRASSRANHGAPRAARGKPPVAPAELDDRARLLWGELAPVLWADGRLLPEYLPAFEALCCAGGRLREADEILRREGQTIAGLKGRSLPHPALRIEKAARESFLDLARQFGLTPASRARIPADGGADPRDALDSFRAGTGPLRPE
jgi:P27 family predicted phage terminase small subunit